MRLRQARHHGGRAELQAAGFGFGVSGSANYGRFYDFDEVSRRTSDPRDVNTRTAR